MNPTTYNISLVVGLGLIADGVAQAVSVPAALIVSGGLIISLAVLGAFLSRKG